MGGLDPRIHFFSKMMVGHVTGLNIKAGNDGGGQEEKILRYSRSLTRRQLLKARPPRCRSPW
jgi:hypothetical protein